MKNLLSLVASQQLPKFKLPRYKRMSRLTVDGFKNFFRYWNNGIKQNEAIEALYAAMPVSLLEEDSTWAISAEHRTLSRNQCCHQKRLR